MVKDRVHGEPLAGQILKKNPAVNRAAARPPRETANHDGQAPRRGAAALVTAIAEK
jgi:hypothetical protein